MITPHLCGLSLLLPSPRHSRHYSHGRGHANWKLLSKSVSIYLSHGQWQTEGTWSSWLVIIVWYAASIYSATYFCPQWSCGVCPPHFDGKGTCDEVCVSDGCKLLGWFLMTACYLTNCTTVKSQDGHTPFKHWYGLHPDLLHLHEIGCCAFILI